MKHKGGPMMVIAIGIGKKRKGESMRDDDDMENMMEESKMKDVEKYRGGRTVPPRRPQPKPTPPPAPLPGMEKMRTARTGGMLGYNKGGSLKMVEKDGEKVPFFAADGKGKMMGGGMTYGKGGMTRGGRDGCAIRGKTKGRMA